MKAGLMEQAQKAVRKMTATPLTAMEKPMKVDFMDRAQKTFKADVMEANQKAMRIMRATPMEETQRVVREMTATTLNPAMALQKALKAVPPSLPRRHRQLRRPLSRQLPMPLSRASPRHHSEASVCSQQRLETGMNMNIMHKVVAHHPGSH